MYQNACKPTCPTVRPCNLASTGDLHVLPRVRQGTVLQWDLASIPEISEWPGPIYTAIDFAHVNSPDPDAWTELADYEERAGVFTLSRQMIHGNDRNEHYRLRVWDGDSTVVTTRPVHFSERLPGRSLALYNEAVRRWYLRASQGELRSGRLLKRRRWGAYCSVCRDRDGGQQNRSQCGTCYDTGFDGGYFLTTGCFHVETTESKLSEFTQAQHGPRQDGPSMQMLMLNIPHVYPGDVWVDLATDERWVLGSPMTTTIRIAQIELFRTLPAVRLDTANVLYDFPLE